MVYRIKLIQESRVVNDITFHILFTIVKLVPSASCLRVCVKVDLHTHRDKKRWGRVCTIVEYLEWLQLHFGENVALIPKIFIINNLSLFLRKKIRVCCLCINKLNYFKIVFYPTCVFCCAPTHVLWCIIVQTSINMSSDM